MIAFPSPPRLCAAFFVCLVASAARAEPLGAGLDCGPDAFSSAELVERRPPRRGPLTAMPQTLCSELAPQVPPAQIDIHLYPGLGSGSGARLGSPVGRPGPGDPYEGGRRGHFPRP
ncbi:hypothetical protein OWC43_16780 [Methylorubrum sp. POS3]|nr:hypothetical protein [Methylobacterium sp. L1A1]